MGSDPARSAVRHPHYSNTPLLHYSPHLPLDLDTTETETETDVSFRIADLKKSVRKGREGYQVTPARLESRQHLFQIEFVLQQFEAHLGRPRRDLDPDLLLDFIGDARLGRGLLATLSQWYRMRSRTFAEVLDSRKDDGRRYTRLLEHGAGGPVELRAWLYGAANLEGSGYLDPAGDEEYWRSRTRALGLRREALELLSLLDRPEEAVLVRTGPRPHATDVVAAYNARAHSTLLRSAVEVSLVCGGATALVRKAAEVWAEPLGVEWSVEAHTLRLSGRADALGCWTRHGRRLERVVLELLAAPELGVREVKGRLTASEKECRFAWKDETLCALTTAAPAPLTDALPQRLEALALLLRRERERGGDANWGVRQGGHLLGAARGTWLPHVELRRGDLSLYLRASAEPIGNDLNAFVGKTPVVTASGRWELGEPVTLTFPGDERVSCLEGAVLPALDEWLTGPSGTPLPALAAPQPLLKAA